MNKKYIFLLLIILAVITVYFISSREPTRNDKVYFGLHLNIDLLLKKAKEISPTKDLMEKFTQSPFDGLKITATDLYFCKHESQMFQMVLFLKLDTAKLETFLSQNLEFSKFVEKAGAYYKFNEKALEELKNSEKETTDKKEKSTDAISDAIEAELYKLRMTWLNGEMIIAREEELQKFVKGPDAYRETFSTSATRLIKGDNLATLFFTIPTDIPEEWAGKLLEEKTKEYGEFGKIFSGVADVLDHFTDEMRKLDQFAFAFRFDGDKRVMQVISSFHDYDIVSSTMKQYSSPENAEELNVLIANITEMKKKKEAEISLTEHRNAVKLVANWNEAKDEVIKKKLVSGAFGIMMMGASMEQEPSKGEVVTRYRSTPRINPNAKIGNLKQLLKTKLAQSLFPSHYFGSGETPSMNLEVEPILLPNSELVNVEYKVLHVYDRSRRDFLVKKKQNAFLSSFKLFSANKSFIQLNVKKGTKAESLKHAEIEFTIKYPTEIAVAEFKAGDKKKTRIKTSGVTFTLNQLEKDVASVNGKGVSSLNLFSFDKTGKALSSSGNLRSALSVSYKFSGIIDKLKVVGVKKMSTIKFKSMVPLNHGKSIQFPQKATGKIRERYQFYEQPEFLNLPEKAFKDLKIEWLTEKKDRWKDQLQISVAKGPLSGSAKWEVYLLESDGKEIKNQDLGSFSSSGLAQYTYKKEELSNVAFAYGKVKFTMNTNIESLSFSNIRNSSKAKKLKSGKEVFCASKLNEITITHTGAKLLAVSAYSKDGLQLMEGSTTYNSSKNNKVISKKYWGIPHTVKVQVSTEVIEHVYEFENKRKPIDEKIVKEHKAAVMRDKEIYHELFSMNQNTRAFLQSPYGLATAYYVYDRKGKQLEKISLVAANSDPIGAKYFNYKLKPYKGYFYTFSKGTVQGKKNVDHQISKYEKKYNWSGGELKGKQYSSSQCLVAIPSEKGMPVYAVNYNGVYRLDNYQGDYNVYVPNSFYNTNWKKLSFILD